MCRADHKVQVESFKVSGRSFGEYVLVDVELNQASGSIVGMLGIHSVFESEADNVLVSQLVQVGEHA